MERSWTYIATATCAAWGAISLLAILIGLIQGGVAGYQKSRQHYHDKCKIARHLANLLDDPEANLQELRDYHAILTETGIR